MNGKIIVAFCLVAGTFAARETLEGLETENTFSLGYAFGRGLYGYNKYSYPRQYGSAYGYGHGYGYGYYGYPKYGYMYYGYPYRGHYYG